MSELCSLGRAFTVRPLLWSLIAFAQNWWALRPAGDLDFPCVEVSLEISSSRTLELSRCSSPLTRGSSRCVLHRDPGTYISGRGRSTLSMGTSWTTPFSLRLSGSAVPMAGASFTPAVPVAPSASLIRSSGLADCATLSSWAGCLGTEGTVSDKLVLVAFGPEILRQNH